MPVTRRKSSNRALIGNSQPTLTFNSRSARVTKPTVEHTSKLTKKAAAKVDSIVSDEQTIPPSPLTTEEEVALAVRSNEEETEAERAVEETEAGRQARKITAVQIKKYWRAKEDERKAPRGTCPQSCPLSKIHQILTIHSSPPIRPHRPRQSPAALRSLLSIRTLHRHRAT